MPNNMRDGFIAELGPDVGDEYYRLYVYQLHARVQLKEYRELFDDKGNVAILNAIGGSFFRDIQLIMQDSLILHITRLTDRPGTGHFRNLSLRMLMQRLKCSQNIPRPERFRDKMWLNDLDDLVTHAEDSAEYARRHRNERIAHLDFDTTKGFNTDESLKPLNLDEVRLVLKNIFKVLRHIYGRMCPDTDLMYSVSYDSGAGHFLAREKLRIHFLTYLEKLTDPEHESDPYTDEQAALFYNRFNVDLHELDQGSLWKHTWLYNDFRFEAKELRDSGMPGPTDKWP